MGNTLIAYTKIVQDIIKEAPEEQRSKVSPPGRFEVPQDVYNIMEAALSCRNFKWEWNAFDSNAEWSSAFLIFDGKKDFELIVKDVHLILTGIFANMFVQPGVECFADNVKDLKDIVATITTILHYTHSITQVI